MTKKRNSRRRHGGNGWTRRFSILTRQTRNKKTNRKSRHNTGGKKVVGKIYSNGCGHCVALEKPWQDVTNKLKGGNVVVKDIEASNMDNELKKLNNTYLGGNTQKVSLQVGFPTIYKINGGNVSYYEGNRDTEPILSWINNP
jgi:hypothetical protein